MNSKSGAFRYLGVNRKQDRLAGDKVFVLVVALIGLVAAVGIVYLGTPLFGPVDTPASAASAAVSPAHWSALGQSYAPNYEGSTGTGVPLTIDPEEAYALSLAQTGQGCSGPVAGQLSAALGIGPDEAYALSLTQTGQGPSGASDS